jgi:hypothetical protein
MLEDDGGDGLSAGRGGTRFEPSGGASGRSGSGGTGSGGRGSSGMGGARGGSAGASGGAGTASGGSGTSGAAGAAMAGAAGTGMSGGAGAAGTSAGGAAGSGSDEPFPSVAFTGCALSTPLYGGFAQCSNGLLHRQFAGDACPSSLPRASAFAPEVLLALEQAARNAGYAEFEIPFLYECREDTDCSALPNGYCDLTQPEGWTGSASFTQCRYACSTDADCGGGTLCECGEPGARCVTARCFEDAECGAGRRCAPYDATPGCEFESRIWECQRPDDECSLDVHCGEAQACIFIEGRRRCAPPICG